MRVGGLKAIGVAGSLAFAASGLAATATPAAAQLLTVNPVTPLAQSVKASQDDATRMTVPVMVDGQGPYPFVIDTGADHTVISTELAGKLALQPGDPVDVSNTGGVNRTPTARIADLDVGPRRLESLSAPTLAEANLGAMGMLGIDSLADQRMVMDFHHNRMSVEPSKRERFGTDTIVVHAKSRYGQLILMDASVNGAPVLVILDSGAQVSIGNPALRKLAHDHGDLRLTSEVISVCGGTTPAAFAYLPQVKVGGVDIANLPIAFADVHTFAQFGMDDRPAMLLGMDILRKFDRVVVDFGRKEVRFQMPL